MKREEALERLAGTWTFEMSEGGFVVREPALLEEIDELDSAPSTARRDSRAAEGHAPGP